MWRLPARRPVRPVRWRNAATLGGSLTWVARSRSPTSTPSSSVDVATITQSRASANACSARCRSSSGSEACDRNVVTPALTQRGADLLDQLPGIAEHQPFLAPVQRRNHRRGVADRPHVIQLDIAGRRRHPSQTDVPGSAAARAGPAAGTVSGATTRQNGVPP